MPDTISVDDAVDNAGDGAIEVASLQSAPVTLDSIMALLTALKAELDGVKAKQDITPPASVTIEITCRPSAGATIPVTTIPVLPPAP